MRLTHSWGLNLDIAASGLRHSPETRLALGLGSTSMPAPIWQGPRGWSQTGQDVDVRPAKA